MDIQIYKSVPYLFALGCYLLDNYLIFQSIKAWTVFCYQRT